MAKLSPLMIAPPVIFAGLAAVFFIGMQREDPDALPSALEGREAPEVVLTQLGPSEPFGDEALRAGEVALVNFWASWCAPCRVEHPNLTELAEAGLPIYGVNYKDEPDKALAFLKELGDPYSGIGADPQGRMALNWGLYGVPETYIVDGDGTILLRFAGPLTDRVVTDRILPALKDAGVSLPARAPAESDRS
ncbi:DsbE family thiol:disulfide interchange protein [Pseudooceanicola aestuarii]|uniref:DsbE family thiol:disulfide interchange protein n=1 Tax=Pseudooceanicola aestuarii TaxID=2697319 RepID=UPI0013D3A31B|nr:DsbE family thiol:disulfide interchange protein [Pseudooceanicola aestuarii]